jgi:hypothetical protein
MYKQLLPMATNPSPLCLLWNDIGYLSLANQQYVEAAQALEQSVAICPEHPLPPNRPDMRPALAESIYQTIHHYLQTTEQTEQLTDLEQAWSQGWLTAEDVMSALMMDDLLQRYEQGDVVVDNAAAPEPVQAWEFTLPDEPRQDVLFMHPPAQIQYNLTLPPQPVTLRFRVAMLPDSWSWGGDGATFVVTIQPATGNAVELYRHHVSNQPVDQQWHLANVSLADYAGQTVQLTFHTETGPAGDNVGDWAGWETPRLLWLVEPTQP